MKFYHGRDGRPAIAFDLALRPAAGGGESSMGRGLQAAFSACSRGKAPPDAVLADEDYQRGPNIPLPLFAARDESGKPTGKLDASEALRRLDWLSACIDEAKASIQYAAEHAHELEERANKAARDARSAALLSVPLGRIVQQQQQSAPALETAPAKPAKKAPKKASLPDHAFEVGGVPPPTEEPAAGGDGFNV